MIVYPVSGCYGITYQYVTVSSTKQFDTLSNNKIKNDILSFTILTFSPLYRFFCDSFVGQLIPTLLSSIFKCRTISEVGAEQLLLDMTSIKCKERKNVNLVCTYARWCIVRCINSCL